MAKKNEQKENIIKILRILKGAVGELENHVNDLSKSQYDKGWNRGKKTALEDKAS